MYWKRKKLLLILHTILSISNKVRVIWSEWLTIFTSDMLSQQLVEAVASLVVQALVSEEKGAKHYTFNTLSMEIFDNVNQRMHQFVIIKTERVILSFLDIIFPDLDKADVVVGKVALV